MICFIYRIIFSLKIYEHKFTGKQFFDIENVGAIIETYTLYIYSNYTLVFIHIARRPIHIIYLYTYVYVYIYRLCIYLYIEPFILNYFYWFQYWCICLSEYSCSYSGCKIYILMVRFIKIKAQKTLEKKAQCIFAIYGIFICMYLYI